MMLQHQFWLKQFAWVQHRAAARGAGSNLLLYIGLMLMGIMLSSLIIDIPAYFAAQNQLQTTVNAAALAGAHKLGEGNEVANQSAYAMAGLNPVMGQAIGSEQLDITINGMESYSVLGSVRVPTLMARFTCGLTGSYSAPTEGNAEAGQDTCISMQVMAKAKAIPAARDVMLVFDLSKSMNSLGNGQPFGYVKQAGLDYITQVTQQFANTADRIGVASFDYSGRLNLALKSSAESNRFQTVRNTISGLAMYSGSQGWNTNYHAGVKAALDELQARGRKNATKMIIFLTDGYPNLPDTSAYRYTTCINYLNSGDTAMNNYRNELRRGRTSSANNYLNQANNYYAQSKTCAIGYTNHFVNLTTQEINRAKTQEVTIHTIQIGGPPQNDASLAVIREMLQNPTWDSQLLATMATTTEGQQYSANTWDGVAMSNIYKTIAKDVRMRLAQ